jgi:VanZ family protein
MQFITRFFLRILPILYMLFIWLQSSKFNPSSLEGFSYQISKPVFITIGITLEMAHLLEFGLLYLFIVIAFLSFGPLNKLKTYIALSISMLYGIVDEIHQYYIPFRSASVDDLLKNFIGVILIWFIIHRSYHNRNESKIGLLLKKVSNLASKDKTDVTL